GRWIKYDYENRPVQVVLQNGTSTFFTYDYQGQRVTKIASGKKTIYIGTVYEEYSGSSETIKYIFGVRFFIFGSNLK
ncbi:MAG: hypothetical protein ACEQSC_02430, partial [Candidatus Nanopelagicaceae bacterium]